MQLLFFRAVCCCCKMKFCGKTCVFLFSEGEIYGMQLNVLEQEAEKVLFGRVKLQIVKEMANKLVKFFGFNGNIQIWVAKAVECSRDDFLENFFFKNGFNVLHQF